MIFFKHVCYVCAHYYMHIHFLVCVCVYSAHVHVCSSSSPRELALLQALFSRAPLALLQAYQLFSKKPTVFKKTNCFQKDAHEHMNSKHAHQYKTTSVFSNFFFWKKPGKKAAEETAVYKFVDAREPPALERRPDCHRPPCLYVTSSCTYVTSSYTYVTSSYT